MSTEKTDPKEVNRQKKSRPKTIRYRVTDDQYANIVAAASAFEMNLSDYCRRVTAGVYPFDKPRPVAPAPSRMAA